LYNLFTQISPIPSLLNYGKQAVSPRSDTGGEVDFRKEVLLFLSTKDGRYSPLEERNSPFKGIFSHFLISPAVIHALARTSAYEKGLY